MGSFFAYLFFSSKERFGIAGVFCYNGAVVVKAIVVKGSSIMKKKLLIILCFLSLTILSACSMVEEGLMNPVDPDSKEMVVVEVPEGATASQISAMLQEEGLIKSRGALLSFLKKEALTDQIMAGKYELSKSMNVPLIAEILTSGQVYEETISVLIPEGYEFRMIADTLVEKMGIDREKFIELANHHDFSYKFIPKLENRKYRLEGYLFPATYEFEKGAGELEILTAMLEKFNREFKPEYYTRAEELGMSVDEIVTMASIVEREGASHEEFPKIAGVFYNRIEDGMFCQSCATVQYILEERKEDLLYSDLEIESPYNTYLYDGLPPGPIASPGLEALRAALYPEKHSYYFFVVTGDKDGRHIFSETEEEHEEAKARAYEKLEEE